METTLAKAAARFTWLTAIRGAVAILFGVIVLAAPTVGVAMLLALFGVYAAVDGLLSIALAVREGRAGGRWGWWLFEGLVSIALAVLAFAQPVLTLVALVWLVAVRAILLGTFSIAAAISVPTLDNRWLLGVTGGVSALFGFLLFAVPAAQGVLTLLWLIGMYAIVVGLMLIVLAIGSAVEHRKLMPLHPQTQG